MNSRNVLTSLMIAAVVLASTAAASSPMPREPLALSPVGAAFAAPYDAVWEATLKSLGAVELRTADKAAGRIETGVYTFTFTAIPGQDGGTQVLWISMGITVARAADNTTTVQVEPRIHDALLRGFTPGPTNNPWLDLFARIQGNLGRRQ